MIMDTEYHNEDYYFVDYLALVFPDLAEAAAGLSNITADMREVDDED